MLKAEATGYNFELLYLPEICLTPDPITIAQAKFASDLSNEKKFTEIIELGTGSGVFLSYILLNSTQANLHVKGIDIDPKVLEIAEFNLGKVAALRNFPSSVYSVKLGDWLKHEKNTNQVDFIYANPPYLPIGTKVRPEFIGNPMHALYAENDGLQHYEIIISQAKEFLKTGGYLFLRTSRHKEKVNAVSDLISKIMPNSSFEYLKFTAQDRKGAGLLIKFLL